MGLFGKLFNKAETETPKVTEESGILYLPIAGEVIPLSDINDGVFSAGVLGLGCGIKPREEVVYAPVSGIITTVADTKHAVGIRSADGAEVLIHVGMDTVEMNGTGFSMLVVENQSVKCGEPILKFSLNKISAAGHPTTTAFVVTNSEDFPAFAVLSTGELEKLTPVMRVQ